MMSTPRAGKASRERAGKTHATKTDTPNTKNMVPHPSYRARSLVETPSNLPVVHSYIAVTFQYACPFVRIENQIYSHLF